MDRDVVRCPYASRRQSTTSSFSPSPESSESPEGAVGTTTSPSTQADCDDLLTKVEELDVAASFDDEQPFKDEESAGGFALVPAKRARGRPRKSSVPSPARMQFPRSKTGCVTCRRRKKKCDETRPVCSNCTKNNVRCEGYQPQQYWQPGKQLSVMARPPPQLPQIINAVDTELDQQLLSHFTFEISHVLNVHHDSQNPFLDIIIPMALTHTGLMHSVLCLSGSCLIAREERPSRDLIVRQAFHFDQAVVALREDLDARHSRGDLAVDLDPTIAQTLLHCIETIGAGNSTGNYRFHLQAAKALINSYQSPNQDLRNFVLEFLIYQNASNSITSLESPYDQEYTAMLEDFQLPDFVQPNGAASLLGVLDQIFGLISNIRHIRDEIRARRDEQNRPWWADAQLFRDAFEIDKKLREWTSNYPPDTPQYYASLLYRQCTWIYLYRTMKPSVPSEELSQGVNDCLVYLQQLPDAGWTRGILLMPLFILGCAAFDPHQRPAIRAGFDSVQSYSNMGNVKHARQIVERVWQMMDEGREEETWDWETIMANMGLDLLVS